MSDLTNALRAYQQADNDGVLVLVSRQACDEGAARIEALEDALMKATSIGMSTILVRVPERTPYLNRKLEELRMMRVEFCEAAFQRNRERYTDAPLEQSEQSSQGGGK